MFDNTVVGYVISSIGDMFIAFANFWFSIPVGDLPITLGEIILMVIFFGVALRLLLGISFHGGVNTRSKVTKKMDSDVEEETKEDKVKVERYKGSKSTSDHKSHQGALDRAEKGYSDE